MTIKKATLFFEAFLAHWFKEGRRPKTTPSPLLREVLLTVIRYLKNPPIVRHEVKTSWGTSVTLISGDGKGLIKISISDGEKYGTISDLHVHPSERRRGLGSHLLSLAENEVKNLYGREVVLLYVDVEDKEKLFPWYGKKKYFQFADFPQEGYYTLYKYL